MKLDFSPPSMTITRKGGKVRLQLTLSVEHLEAMLAAARADSTAAVTHGDAAVTQCDAATVDVTHPESESQSQKEGDGDARAGPDKSGSDAKPPPEPEADPDLEADWRDFLSRWPGEVLDPPKARAELRRLAPADRKACIAKLADYDAYLRRSSGTVMRPHLFVKKRSWEGLNKIAPPSALHFVPAKDPGGAAVRVLAALLGNASVPQHWCGRGPDGVTFGYWLWFELNPRFTALGLAHPPRIPMPNRHHWPEFRAHSQHHGAWQSFIDTTMGPDRRKHLPVEGGKVRAPWPFPPLVDGSLSKPPFPGAPSSTGPPLGDLSERDEADFVGSS